MERSSGQCRDSFVHLAVGIEDKGWGKLSADHGLWKDSCL